MRIRLNDRRERRFDNLVEATGEGSKSGALDTAADYYLRMSGGNPAIPTGKVEELMQTAVEEGSVTPEEIAEILGTDELPIDYSHDWSVGDDS